MLVEVNTPPSGVKLRVEWRFARSIYRTEEQWWDSFTGVMIGWNQTALQCSASGNVCTHVESSITVVIFRVSRVMPDVSKIISTLVCFGAKETRVKNEFSQLCMITARPEGFCVTLTAYTPRNQERTFLTFTPSQNTNTSQPINRFETYS